jgi:hypothetical protein
MAANIGLELMEIRVALTNSRGDLVVEPRITAAALAHLLLCSRELLQNLLIDTAKRTSRSSGIPHLASCAQGEHQHKTGAIAKQQQFGGCQEGAKIRAAAANFSEHRAQAGGEGDPATTAEHPGVGRQGVSEEA